MNNLKTNIIFWLSVSYFVIYALLFWFTGYEVTSYVIAAMLFGLSVMVMVTWFTTGVTAFRSGGRDGEAILAFMICVIAFYGITTRIWTVYKLGIGSPEWTNSSAIGLSNAVLLLIFFTGILLAPETKGGEVPRKNLILWGVATFVAGIFIGVSVGVAIVAPVERSAQPAQHQMFPSTSPAQCSGGRPVLVRSFCRARPNLTTVGG